jgi:uncharacterized damage-inducible protein DinB
MMDSNETLTRTVATSLSSRYSALASRVRELAEPLSQEQFWHKPFSFGNSFGHLVLHLTGNLNYYIGAQIAQTGYVRDRDLEFTDAKQPSKAEIMRRFDEAVAMVTHTTNAQSASDWSSEYTAQREDATNRFDILLRCATHFHLHVGQMIYLTYALQASQPPQ